MICDAILLEEVSSRVVARVFAEQFDSACALWTTYTLSELAGGEDSWDDSAERAFAVKELQFRQPFGTNQCVTATFAKASGGRAIDLIVNRWIDVTSVVTVGDVDEPQLINWFKTIYSDQRLGDMDWFADQMPVVRKFAECSLWNDLPCPDIKGNLKLLVSRNAGLIESLVKSIEALIDEELARGADPTVSRTSQACASVTKVNAAAEIRKHLPTKHS